jgi:hypothetical protein
VRKLPEGMILREAASVAPGDDVAVKLSIGQFQAKVVKIEKG